MSSMSIVNTPVIEETQSYVTELLNEYLPSIYTYHNLNHTLDVVAFCKSCIHYYDFDQDTCEELLLAAWFHDTGYIRRYHGHEKESAEIAREFLKERGLHANRIKRIEELILSTQKEHKSQNLLEEILHDADTQHLGKKSFFKKKTKIDNKWKKVETKFQI